MKNSFQVSAALLTMAVSCLPVWAAQDNVSQAQATSAGAAVESTSPVTSEPAVINHVVYLARLPTPAELMKGAELQGTKIARIDQTSDRIVVAYEYSGGRTVTFAYTLLTGVASYPAPAMGTASPTSTVVYSQPAPPAQVVYTQPATVYYPAPYVSYYDPAWDFWGPLAVGVGIGLIGGHDGGWHGGWHGGHFGHVGGWHH